MLIANQFTGFGGGGGGLAVPVISASPGGVQTSSVVSGGWTLSGYDIGTAGFYVIAINILDSSPRSPLTTMTIGGQAMTSLLQGIADTQNYYGLFYLKTSLTGPQDVLISTSPTGTSYWTMSMIQITNVEALINSNVTLTSTGNSALTRTIDETEGYMTVAVNQMGSTGGYTTPNWTTVSSVLQQTPGAVGGTYYTHNVAARIAPADAVGTSVGIPSYSSGTSSNSSLSVFTLQPRLT